MEIDWSVGQILEALRRHAARSTTRWWSSPRTTARGSATATTPVRPRRCARARARCSTAAAACRRSCGGPARFPPAASAANAGHDDRPLADDGPPRRREVARAQDRRPGHLAADSRGARTRRVRTRPTTITGAVTYRRCAWAAGSCIFHTVTARWAVGRAEREALRLPTSRRRSVWPCSTWRPTSARPRTWRPSTPRSSPTCSNWRIECGCELGDSATQQEGSGVREAGQLAESDPRFHWVPAQPPDAEPR